MLHFRFFPDLSNLDLCYRLLPYAKNYYKKPKSCTYLQLNDCINVLYPMKRDIFQAIADPTRRAVLVLIATQAMTPNALAEQFDITRQAVSKHIKILKECQLIEEQKKGREIYYQLKLEKMKEIDQWLEQFRQHWEDRFSQLDQVLVNLKIKKDEN
jgi:DNA-binding transcriptional ArsR family regulator